MFPPTVSDIAVSNYKALFGVSLNAIIVKVVQQKTDNLQTSENSLMSTVSFLFAVIRTHLFVGKRTGIYYSIKKKTISGE